MLAEVLIPLIECNLKELSIPATRGKLSDSRFNRQLSFKISPKKMLCYVQFENRIKPDDPFDLAFRFKRGDNPANWKTKHDESALWTSIHNRFIQPWSRQRGYPGYCCDDTGERQQFALHLTREDVMHPDFNLIIKFLLQVAYYAVNRDWTAYDSMRGKEHRKQ